MSFLVLAYLSTVTRSAELVPFALPQAKIAVAIEKTLNI